MRNKLSRAVETRFIASQGPLDSRFRGNDDLEEEVMLEKNPLKIKALISETVNYGHNAAVLFEVELKDGSFVRINVAQLFTDREFIDALPRDMYGHVCRRKGYMMRG